MKPSTQGTLLIQLSIAITGVIVLVGLGFTTISFYQRYFLAADAQSVKTLLLYVQQKAILSQEEIKITCDQLQRKFITPERSQELARGVFFGYLPGVMGPPSKPQQLIHSPITFSNNIIHCYPDGTISSGTVYLVDAQKKCMYAITCPSGQASFIRIYRYDTQWTEVA